MFNFEEYLSPLLDRLQLDFTKTDKKVEEVIKKLRLHYKDSVDPWGLDLDTVSSALKILYPIFKHYFKLRSFGIENIPKDRPIIVVSNHSGQIPIDGLIIGSAFLLHTEDPILLRAMVEKFLIKLPFFGKIAQQSGAILGDRKNCRYLLNRKESILVFPEGVRGISKNTQDFYKLQDFTLGFYRLALEKNAIILPASVIGAEQFYPFVHHSKLLAKLLKVPALPLTPLFPLTGILGLIPMPSPVDIHIGEAIKMPEHLNENSPDYLLRIEVDKIQKSIQEKIDIEKKNRRKVFGVI